MLDNITKKRIDDLRDILLGKTPSPQSQVEQITTGLIYKFMYDIDSQAKDMGGIPSFFVGDYEKYSWDKLFDPKLIGAKKVELYSEAIEKMYNNPNAPSLFREIFKNSFLPFKDPKILNMFLKEINKFNYSDSEILGDAYEYLISFLGKQGDAGQFRTPRHIIDFIVKIINPQKHETILDPACGTSGFLISSYKFILNKNSSLNAGDQLTAFERKKMSENLVGYDLDPTFVKISLVNLHLNKLTNPKIYEYDTLTSDDKWNEFFDVILANPPFMNPKGGIQPHSKFGLQSTRSEVLFVDYILEHLCPNGRAGIIVPEGIIIKTGGVYKKLRKKLVENALIGVISLPSGVFLPYSGVKTSILILDKKRNANSKEIFFSKIDNDGFNLGAQRNVIPDNDLPEIYEEITKFLRKEDNNLHFENKSSIISDKRISLNIADYQKESIDKKTFKMVKLGDENFFEIVSGGTPKSDFPSYWDGQINWISLADLDANKLITKINSSKRKITDLGLKKSSAKVIPINSIIVSTRATIGRVAINQTLLATNQGFKNIIIKDSKNVSYEFVAYMMTFLKERMINLASGATFKEISKTSFEELSIPIPEIEKQKEIVAELNSFNKVIQNCKEIIKTYKPYFEIDSSWELLEVGDICEFAYGKGLKESERIEGEYDVYGSNGVVGSHNTFLIEHPFIVIGRKGSAGVVHFSNKNGFPIDTTFYISKKELHKKDINLKFLYYYFKKLDLTKLVGDQTIPGLNRNSVYKKQILIPKKETQDLLVKSIEHEESLIESNKQLIKIFENKIQQKIASVWD